MGREKLESPGASVLPPGLTIVIVFLPLCDKAAIKPRERCEEDSANPKPSEQEFLRSGRAQARPSRQNAARGKQHGNQKFLADQPRKRKAPSLKPLCCGTAGKIRQRRRAQNETSLAHE